MLPRLPPDARVDPDAFRRERFYTEEVEALIIGHQPLLLARLRPLTFAFAFVVADLLPARPRPPSSPPPSAPAPSPPPPALAPLRVLPLPPSLQSLSTFKTLPSTPQNPPFTPPPKQATYRTYKARDRVRWLQVEHWFSLMEGTRLMELLGAWRPPGGGCAVCGELVGQQRRRRACASQG